MQTNTLEQPSLGRVWQQNAHIWFELRIFYRLSGSIVVQTLFVNNSFTYHGLSAQQFFGLARVLQQYPGSTRA